jgi:hypothetical protein
LSRNGRFPNIAAIGLESPSHARTAEMICFADSWVMIAFGARLRRPKSARCVWLDDNEIRDAKFIENPQ